MKKKGTKLFEKEYNIIQHLGGGSYGSVYKIEFQDKPGEYYALKKIDVPRKEEGIEISGLREITILKELHHENIERIYETFYDESHIFMLLEYAEFELSYLIGLKVREGRPKKNYFTNEADLKNILLQILKGIATIHKNGVLHRDLSPSNILINDKGELKIVDFGLARFVSSDDAKLTGNVVTMNYRAPEIFFGAELYSSAIDIWSVGVIFGECIKGEFLFPGTGDIKVLTEIFFLLGVRTETNWPDAELLNKFELFEGGDTLTIKKKFEGCSPECIDLLEKMLVLDPNKRATAEELLNHPYFSTEPIPSTNDKIKEITRQYKMDY